MNDHQRASAAELVDLTRRHLEQGGPGGSVVVLRTRSEPSRKLASEVDNGLRAHGVRSSIVSLPKATRRLRVTDSTSVLVDATTHDPLVTAQLAALAGRPVVVPLTGTVATPALSLSRHHLSPLRPATHVAVLEDIAMHKVVVRGGEGAAGSLTTSEHPDAPSPEEAGGRTVALSECTLTLECDRSVVRIELESRGCRYQWWTSYADMELTNGFDLHCDGADPKPVNGSFVVSRLDAPPAPQPLATSFA